MAKASKPVRRARASSNISAITITIPLTPAARKLAKLVAEYDQTDAAFRAAREKMLTGMTPRQQRAYDRNGTGGEALKPLRDKWHAAHAAAQAASRAAAQDLYIFQGPAPQPRQMAELIVASLFSTEADRLVSRGVRAQAAAALGLSNE